MAPSTTKYSEIQHDEIEALRSIYMEEFQEESLKVGAWNVGTPSYLPISPFVCSTVSILRHSFSGDVVQPRYPTYTLGFQELLLPVSKGQIEQDWKMLRSSL